jgi:hypothetical protein
MNARPSPYPNLRLLISGATGVCWRALDPVREIFLGKMLLGIVNAIPKEEKLN